MKRSSSSNPSSAKKARRISKTKEDVEWPEHFTSLFAVFKALNTVLAFISSKKQIATTFDAIRSPLELQAVAEIKALLPDIVKFSYIPRNDSAINENADLKGKHRAKSPDFVIPSTRVANARGEGRILVLEFADNLRGKKSRNVGLSYQQAPSLTPAAMKLLIETRNDIFGQAVNDLILATMHQSDPVQMLQQAAREHVPVVPYALITPSDQECATNTNARPSVNDLVQKIMDQDWYREQIIFRKTVDAREPLHGELGSSLSPSITSALATSRSIGSFYAHQSEAIRALFEGKHVVVSTSTASGKSLIYQVPILKFLEDDIEAKAICIYPTKALEQDQKASLETMIQNCPGLEHIRVSTYDGDTPQEQRPTIREESSVIFTNFDTIHASILPHEDNWRSFLRQVKLVVVDELHYYSGLLGSHVAFIMRRFRRICAAVGNRQIRFISCTATLGNPGAHMQKIFCLGEDEIRVVDTDGAPSGRKDFLVWNPPLIDNANKNLGRRGSISEATLLMRFLMQQGARVLLFCKIRKVCELAMRAIRADLSNEGQLDILAKVKAYRGGYSQEDRRRIEEEAFSGQLLGIIATNALELGIDIGALDIVIMLGFPMSVASFRQQAGRAGRRVRDSLAIFVADPFPIDQYYVNHSEELFSHAMEDLVIDTESPVILEAHLQCAAHEMPIHREDKQYFGPLMPDICEKKLLKDRDGWYQTHPNFLPYPPRFVSIRGAQEERYAVICVKTDAANIILEEVEVSRAMFEVYEGGIFMHQGEAYIVTEVSHDNKIAKVIQANVNYHTSPRDFTNVDAVRTTRIRAIGNHRAFYGMVNVEVKVFGFFKIRNNTILDAVEIDTPPYVCDTTGFWIDVPRSILELLRRKHFNLAEAIHAAQHAFLNQFPLSEDLRTECKAAEKEIIFYDSIGKGGGVAAKAFDYAHETLRKAHSALENCHCEEGCGNCVQSATCREANQVSSKLGGGIIIRSILGLPIDPDVVTLQSGQQIQIPDTIAEAQTVYGRGNIEVEEEGSDRLH
ncbi:hypothetical protein AGABI1DRAFT_125317 [Agaricus bisporus var. burnettii JB137-S8]|uniref:Uncharacterized protein n=1 Tax=Agaricus bisporus var. burnettii (strain JB137-S8 / ATCC MYA-4627 / FGSC 10392) TaxID=597362 RepID=K5XHS9_AGABU|nr:uncharacterized protein AGABI1DRAFT_125317 [Agaricus bisporus var. burnettii JB137-S8]EKM82852.1 hypothetical protein AGABI1DRAFT_125317 [Agaricus bisporus var. burnettii JB137-S8]